MAQLKLFLDVDGVLIDGYHAKPERRCPWYATLQEDLGVDPAALEREFFEPWIGPIVTGKLDIKDALGQVLPRLGYDGSVEAFIQYWLENDSKLNPEMWAAVQSLSGRDDLAMYVATAQEHRRARYLWEDVGFQRHFDDIFFSAEIGYAKEVPAFFETINAQLSISDAESPLFFDDNAQVVEAAQSAGWTAHLFDTPEDFLTHPTIQAMLPA